MRILVVLFAAFFSLNVHAQESRMKTPPPAPEPSQLHLYLLDLEMRYEKDAGEEWVDRKPLNVAIAYRAQKWSMLFEYSKFTEDSGNDTLSISRKHEDLLLWGRWHLWRYKEERVQLSVYGGAAVGSYQEEVRTTLGGASETDSTGYKIMGGFSAGGDVSMLLTKSVGLTAALEGRGLVASEFDPNPTWSAVLRTGVFFVW